MSENEQPPQMDRRNFLKQGFLAAAALSASGCKSNGLPVSELPQSESTPIHPCAFNPKVDRDARGKTVDEIIEMFKPKKTPSRVPSAEVIKTYGEHIKTLIVDAKKDANKEGKKLVILVGDHSVIEGHWSDERNALLMELLIARIATQVFKIRNVGIGMHEANRTKPDDPFWTNSSGPIEMSETVRDPLSTNLEMIPLLTGSGKYIGSEKPKDTNTRVQNARTNNPPGAAKQWFKDLHDTLLERVDKIADNIKEQDIELAFVDALSFPKVAARLKDNGYNVLSLNVATIPCFPPYSGDNIAEEYIKSGTPLEDIYAAEGVHNVQYLFDVQNVPGILGPLNTNIQTAVDGLVASPIQLYSGHSR